MAYLAGDWERESIVAPRKRCEGVKVHMRQRMCVVMRSFFGSWLVRRLGGWGGGCDQIENYTKAQELKSAREEEVTAGLKLYK